MQNSDLKQKQSMFSVHATLEKLESAIREKGITIFAMINHSQNAKDIDLNLNESIVVLFGNPHVGTLMMQENIFTSLDLPLKIAIVQDDTGDVWVVYHTMRVLKERYYLSNVDVLAKVDALLDSLTDLATR